MKKHKVGLVIGRFQPFHLGHKYLIEEALKVCDKITIGIGSSNIDDKRNPFSYKKRKKILSTFLKEEGLQDQIINIIPVVDHPDDSIWFTKLMKKIKHADVVIGDNEWVNGIFEDKNIPVIRVGFFDRDRLEGKVIRGLINDKKEWADRVPIYLIEQMTSD